MIPAGRILECEPDGPLGIHGPRRAAGLPRRIASGRKVQEVFDVLFYHVRMGA